MACGQVERKIHDFNLSCCKSNSNSIRTQHYPLEIFKIHLLLHLCFSLGMRSPRRPYFLFLLQPNVVIGSTCYWPDGSVVSDQWSYTPCNSTANGVESTCCSQGDVCSSNGYCLGTAGYMYRGACTDSSWNDGSCCQNCRDSMSSSCWYVSSLMPF